MHRNKGNKKNKSTIGTYGISSLLVLIKLVFSFYITSIGFIIVFLGGICWWLKIPFFKVLRYIKEELLTVLGTSSSESVLASIMVKLEQLGCPKAAVGVIVPMGYSFNLDGTNICLTLSMMFIAQAFGVSLSWQEQLTIVGIMMVSSKGAAAVVGSAFITLSATLALFPQFPVAGLMLIYGVDRFLSEGRSLTNLVGNTFATLFLCRWNNLLNDSQMQEALNRKD
jgi:aerobic C4-dicarboxylate transport protein